MNLEDINYFKEDTTDMNKLLVTVDTKNFNQFFEEALHPIAIDSYQRPYIWGIDKLEQLVKDLEEFYAETKDDSMDYYMGTILLHEEKEESSFFVIDGQQRLTSLCILYRVINGKLPNNQNLSYNSPKSVNNIIEADKYFSKNSHRTVFEDLFDRIVFTVISVDSQDLAFTFFDTQNNRGVPLEATDLLKAFHLRGIDGNEERIHLQKLCARRWEGIQEQKKVLGHGSDFAPILFHQFLWRARNWRGKLIERERFDDVIEEFQKQTIKEKSNNTITLYASASNKWGSQLMLLPEDDYRIVPDSIRLSHFAADLPFAIRQPISRGVGFFLYAQKYADLVQKLLNEETSDREIIKFRKLYNNVYLGISLYLRELFLLASIMYVDKFETWRLYEFSLWLDYVLGAIRIEKDYVFKQAPIVFLRDKKRNLLDVISGAFRPEEIIEYLKQDTHAREEYEKENITDYGVKKRYKDSILSYYMRENDISLKDRDIWIKEEIR